MHAIQKPNVVRGMHEREIARFQDEWNKEQRAKLRQRQMDQLAREHEAEIYQFRELRNVHY